MYVCAGPLANGDVAVAIVNRGAVTASIVATWPMLDMPDISNNAAACVQDLYANTTFTAISSVTVLLQSHDIAMLRIKFGAAC